MDNLEDTLSDPVITIRGLIKEFGVARALDGVDLTVERGGIFILFGASGAGKTVLMNVLMGFIRATAGVAALDGLDCFEHRIELKRRVGYVPEAPVFDSFLTGWDVLEFVGAARGMSREAVFAAALPLLDELAMRDMMDGFAAGYPIGMRKKLAVVCAMVHRPPIMLLDDPSAGMDPSAAGVLTRHLCRHARNGGAVLINSGDVDWAYGFDCRAGTLAAGKLIKTGSIGRIAESLGLPSASRPPRRAFSIKANPSFRRGGRG